MNIIKEISAKDYMTFGMCLLQDDNGTAVDLLKKDHIHEGAQSVTRAILQTWLPSGALLHTAHIVHAVSRGVCSKDLSDVWRMAV